MPIHGSCRTWARVPSQERCRGPSSCVFWAHAGLKESWVGAIPAVILAGAVLFAMGFESYSSLVMES